MTANDYPNLLINKDLLRPFERSLQKLRDVQSHLGDCVSDVLLHGVFVMAVSYAEVSLTDSLKYYLTCFPQKLSKEDLRFSKDEFFANYFRLIDAASEKYVIGLSYNSFQDLFAKYLEILSLEWNSETGSLEDDLREIRATRNILLHNAMVVNDLYLEQAGARARAKSKGGVLPLDLDYVKAAVAKMLAFGGNLAAAINEKYRCYTVIAANKRLWNFMFTSPVMPYEDFWHVDEEKDRIVACKRSKYEGQLSSSEELCLGLWRAHFNGDCEYLNRFHMKSLDRSVQHKVMYFLAIASEFRFE